MKNSKPHTKKPYQHNDLFRGDIGSFHLNACVGDNGGPYDYRDYADGYMRAGLSLISAAERHEGPVDILVYPIAYCFRHAIELYLKHFCETLPKLWSEQASPVQTHKLVDNWSIVKEFIGRERLFDQNNIAVSQVDKIISDFVQIDPTAEIFRFPVGRKGDRHLQNLSVINLLVLRSAMSELNDIFTSWDYMSDALAEYKSDNGSLQV